MSGRNAVGRAIVRDHIRPRGCMRQKDGHGCPVPLQGSTRISAKNKSGKSRQPRRLPNRHLTNPKQSRRVSSVIEQITNPTSSNASPPSKHYPRDRLIKSRSFSNSFAFLADIFFVDRNRSVSFKIFREALPSFSCPPEPTRQAISAIPSPH